MLKIHSEFVVCCVEGFRGNVIRKEKLTVKSSEWVFRRNSLRLVHKCFEYLIRSELHFSRRLVVPTLDSPIKSNYYAPMALITREKKRKPLAQWPKDEEEVEKITFHLSCRTQQWMIWWWWEDSWFSGGRREHKKLYEICFSARQKYSKLFLLLTINFLYSLWSNIKPLKKRRMKKSSSSTRRRQRWNYIYFRAQHIFYSLRHGESGMFIFKREEKYVRSLAMVNCWYLISSSIEMSRGHQTWGSTCDMKLNNYPKQIRLI